jgi:hypothetical protein
VANRFWVGGTAAWDNTVGTKWALTSGGAGGQAVPTAADDVFFDAASGTVTISGGNTNVAKSVTCTGFTGTWSSAVALTVSGNLTLAAGMTYNRSAALTFNATANIDTAGKTLSHAVTLNLAGATFTLLSNLTMTGLSANVTLTNGHFNANGFNVSVTSFLSTSTNVRTISMGSGIWTLNIASGTMWDTGTGANLTLNKGTANIVIANTGGGGAKVFNANGQTFNDITLPTSLATREMTFLASVTFANLIVTGTTSIIIVIASLTTLTLLNPPTLVGSPGNYVQLKSQSAIGPGLMSVPSGTVAMEYAVISNLTFTGGAIFIATNSIELTNVTGITIRPPLVRAPTYALGI